MMRKPRAGLAWTGISILERGVLAWSHFVGCLMTRVSRTPPSLQKHRLTSRATICVMFRRYKSWHRGLSRRRLLRRKRSGRQFGGGGPEVMHLRGGFLARSQAILNWQRRRRRVTAVQRRWRPDYRLLGRELRPIRNVWK